MAVTFHNATTTAGPASVGTKTIVHTISAADTCLLVFTHANTAVSISAMAANGLSLTRLGHISASSSRAEVWGLSAGIPIATLSISANVVGAASLNFCLAAVSYTGIRQIGGSPFGTVVAGSAQGVGNIAFSVSSTSTDLVSYGFGLSANTTITVTTGTSRADITHSTTGRLVVGDVTGAATISISATAAAIGTWSFLGVPIVASAAAAPTTLKFDNANATATTTVVNSIGMLLTATANACLIVFSDVAGGNQTLSSVVIGSTNLTFLAAQEWASRRVEAWVLTAPPAGILTISAIIVGAATTSMGLGGVTYTGHKTTGTFGTNVATASVATTTRAQLSVSSTAGNFVVLLYAPDDNASVQSAGPAMNLRASTGNFPALGIADTPGGPAITAIAVGSTAVNWALIGVNLVQSGQISGAATMTDTRDVFSASGQVIVQGRLSATDVTDKFSASGKTIVVGRMSATDAGGGTLSAPGYVLVRGSATFTDLHDTFSASGYLVVSARLSATDAQDKFSASGYVIVSGRMSATDATDLFSASGTVASGNTLGRLSATEAADTFSASGYVIVSGLLSTTDAPDKFSASGSVIATFTTGSLAATDHADTFSATGYVVVSGSVNFTDRPDLFSASGTVVASAAPVVTITPSPGSGGGHKTKQKEYFRPDDAFWEAREKYLISLQPAIASEPEPAPVVDSGFANRELPPVDPSLLIKYRATRSNLIIKAIPDATNMRQLQARGRRLKEVNARIAEQKRLAEQERLTLARLMSEARKEKRVRDIRRIKRRVILLAAARAAVALTYLIDKL